MKTNNKLKIYKVIFKILLIAMLISIILIIVKYAGYQVVEQENKETVEIFNNTEIKTDKEGISQIEMNGYKVIGKIKIPAINLEYPILDITSNISMKTAITRFAGNAVNDYGNLSLAGHNNKDGTMFGKNRKLVIGDVIKLTDLIDNTITYKIYRIFSTNPNDTTILNTEDENVREVTLITCTNGHAQRLIIKAKEIKY